MTLILGLEFYNEIVPLLFLANVVEYQAMTPGACAVAMATRFGVPTTLKTVFNGKMLAMIEGGVKVWEDYFKQGGAKSKKFSTMMEHFFIQQMTILNSIATLSKNTTL